MRDSSGCKKKPIEQVQQSYLRKAKLESVSSYISEKKNTQDGLKELSQAIMENVHIGITLIDYNYKILMVNTMVSRYFYKPVCELIGRECFREFEKREPICPHCPGKRAMETGQPAEIETEGISDNGPPRRIRIQAFPIRHGGADGPPRRMTGFIEIVEDITERKTAEKALKDNEARLRELFDQAPIGYHELDAKGRITRVNRTELNMLGYRAEEMVGQEVWQFIVENETSQQAVTDKISGATPPGRAFERTYKYKNGATIPVLVEDYPLRDETGRIVGIRSTIQDITERRRAEEALRVAEERFSKAFRASPDAMTISRMTNGTLFEVNDMWEKILGYSQAESVGTSTVALGIWSDPAIRQKAVQQLQETGSLRNFETDLLRKTGEVRQVSLSSERLKIGGEQCLLTIIHDITERKRAEEALRQSEERFRKILENAPFGYYRVGKDGLWQYVNPVWERMHGLSYEEVVGKPFEITQPEDMVEQARENVRRSLAGETITGEFGRLKKDGRIEYHSFNIQPVYDGGEIVAIEGFITDITERKKAEQMILKEKDKAQKYLDVAAVMMVAIDAEQRVGLINKKGCQILGYSEDEILGKNWFDNFLPERIRGDVKKIFNKILRSQANISEYHENFVLTGNGDERLIAWHNTILRDDKGDVIATLSSGEDITDRKKAVQAIREAEEKYRTLTENSLTGVFIHQDGKYIFVNERFAQIHGYRPEELLGKAYMALVHPDERDIAAQNLSARLAGKDVTQCYEMRRLKKDGQVIWCEMMASHIEYMGKPAIMGNITDITERKQAEEQIAKLAKFPAEDPHPVLRISAFGTVMYGNKASLPLLKAWRCRVGESLPDCWYRFALDALSSGQSEQTDIQCDGRTFTLTFAPVVDANYVNVYGLDVTQRKQAEQKLLDYQSQLKSLASQLTLAEERERRRIAVELHDRIGQSLAISKVKLDGQRHSISPTDKGEVLEDVCSLLGQAIADVRSLTFDLSSPILHELGLEAAVAAWIAEEIEQKYDITVELEVDKKPKPLDDDIGSLLFRDVRELLFNVVKHSQATKVKVSIRRIGERISISVEDNGMGFVPAEVTAKAVGKGGFGLFSIRERLEQFGGHLQIESAPGGGCKVTMIAPLKEIKIINGG